MSKPRANIFSESEDLGLDIGAFAPKTTVDTDAPKPEKVREVSKAAKFTSREPVAAQSEPKKEKRPTRRYRTGRNVQLNVKAQAETIDLFYALAEQQGWVLGFTLQRAIEALQRELKQSK